MEWRRLALKNGLRNARRYLGYLLSAALAATVFFMFALFTHNSYVVDGPMSSNARYIMEGFRYIVAGFAVVFIVFFHSSMMRYRTKEFGLFLTLGMTPVQVGMMIFLEGLMLGAVALGVGIGLGMLFGKMFLLAMGNILGVSEPIPFEAPRAVFTSTLGMFGTVFVLESLYLALRMAFRSPKSLILGARSRQKAPIASVWLVLLSLVSLGTAYYLAVFHSMELQLYFFPILILTGVGTYFLFTQTLVWVLKSLRKRPLQGIALLVVSRLTYRMRDHARMLTLVTMLTAIVLVGMGTVSATQSVNESNTARVRPVSFNVVYPSDQTAQLRTKLDSVHDLLKTNGTDVAEEIQSDMVLVNVETTNGSKPARPAFAIGQSDFDHWRQLNLKYNPILSKYISPIEPAKPGIPRFIVSYPLMLGELFPEHDVVVKSGNSDWKMRIEGQDDARAINQQISQRTDFMLVLTDEEFQQVKAAAPSGNLWTTRGWMVNDWHTSLAGSNALNTLFAEDVQKGLVVYSDAITVFSQARNILEVMMFAGLFVSTLFFLASCSAIYFRLFAQQEEDALQFAALHRLGFERAEAGRVLTFELALLFFLPFAVAFLHGLFAMKDFEHLLTVEGDIWSPFFLVVGISLLCFVVYFMVARIRYLRQVWR